MVIRLMHQAAVQVVPFVLSALGNISGNLFALQDASKADLGISFARKCDFPPSAPCREGCMSPLAIGDGRCLLDILVHTRD